MELNDVHENNDVKEEEKHEKVVKRGRGRPPTTPDAKREVVSKPTTPIKTSPSASSELNRSVRQTKRRGSAKASGHERKKVHRGCEKSGCNLAAPLCFAAVTDKCAKDGYTSRWYHMSVGEHFCNECFEHFYRSSKGGYGEFVDWRQAWLSNSKSEANIKLFMMDQISPYWVQCMEESCRKWRKLPRNMELSTEVVAQFKCGKYDAKFVVEEGEQNVVQKETCETPEDPRVEQSLKPNWIETLLIAPLMKNSPAADFLGAFYPDGVGLSPTCARSIKAKTTYQECRKLAQENANSSEPNKPPVNGSLSYHPNVPGLNQHLEPFYQPAEQGKALCMRADVMDSEEEQEFREYSKAQIMYLGVRNLIFALWNLNCKKWLVNGDVAAHLLCRGLARVRCIWESNRIVRFLTLRGMINIGILTSPLSARMVPADAKTNVIVIGAGASGIGAARQLQNFGIKVTVLEARNRIGGRIWDDNSFGVCVGKGAQIVTGVVNSPTTIICEQANLPMRYLLEKCDLYLSSGELVDPILDERMEFHFNAALDAVATWRKSAKEDNSLYDKVWDMHRQFLENAQMTFTDDQMKMFHFHLSNLEYACGIHLKEVSALYWDQNEAYEQFAGDHTMLRLGYSTIMEKLAQGVDVRLETIVKKIDYSGDETVITCESGETITASQVLVTVPLAVLQAGDIQFTPAFPEWKQKALSHLGAGVIEKVVLQFPHNFWSDKVCGADFFGFIPPLESERGRFPVFCDMSKHSGKANPQDHVLMTYLCGDAAKLTIEKTDQEIINMCVTVLKSIFKEKEVPDPLKYFVTHWSQDPFSRMVYSYVKIGGSGQSYDDLASDISGKLFFAGEATNRRFPQTVAGAYISGLREACKILRSLPN